MNLQEAGQQLSSLFPPRYAEDWDNGGWNVGPLEESLTGILICVDPSPEAIEAALDRGLNLVLAHHPLIFDPLPSVVDNEPVPSLVHRTIRNRVGVYAAHTSADSMPGGLNDRLASKIGLTETEPLHPQESDRDAGLGRIGVLPEPRSLGEVEETLAEVLPLSRMKSLGAPDETVRRLALCTGSGADFIGPELVESVDLYVTADVKHHSAMEARQRGLSLIVLDHHEMETVFLELARDLCREEFEGDVDVDIYHWGNPYRIRTFENGT